MRREMIVGCVIGMILGGVLDLLLRTDGLGLIGGAVLGGVIGRFVMPARERSVAYGGGDGTASWSSDSSGADSNCGDSGSDGGGRDGGGD